MSPLPNFEEMTRKELTNYAKEHNIDLGDAKNKESILSTVKNYYNINEEETKMENLQNEMVGTELNTGVAGDTAVKAEDKRVFTDNAGNEVSMSAFIREKFTVDNMTRKEISEKFDINYRTVYGATVNMTNDAEPSGRGRSAVNPKISVTEDGKVLSDETVDGVTKFFVNGEEVSADEAAGLDVTEVDRNTWIKEQVAAGVNRGEIAKILGLSYGVVYGLTKEADGSRQKYEIEIEDPENPGQKKTISRSEYIRMKVAEGVSKADVAKELGVEYSVVWQSCKKDKTDADRYADAIATLAKFADKVTDKETFEATLETLKGIAVVEAKEETTEA